MSTALHDAQTVLQIAKVEGGGKMSYFRGNGDFLRNKQGNDRTRTVQLTVQSSTYSTLLYENLYLSPRSKYYCSVLYVS